MALTRWSIDKLARHLAEQQIAQLSSTALRALLDEAGLSVQRTRSWKWSPDPDFKATAERVLGLYRQAPGGGPVVCFDEMGPIQLIAYQGAGWAPVGRPERLRATYNRGGGTRYLFGAYDVHADRLFGRLRARESARDVLGFLPAIRMRYWPKRRIYLVMDNLSTHWTTAIYASFLNRIECHFWAIGEFTIKNADYPGLGHPGQRHGRLHQPAQPHPRRRPDRPTRSPPPRRVNNLLYRPT